MARLSDNSVHKTLLQGFENTLGVELDANGIRDLIRVSQSGEIFGGLRKIAPASTTNLNATPTVVSDWNTGILNVGGVNSNLVNGTMLLPIPGAFEFHFSVSASVNAASTTIRGGIYQNGNPTSIMGGSTFARAGDIGHFASFGILRIAQNDIIDLRLWASSACVLTPDSIHLMSKVV